MQTQTPYYKMYLREELARRCDTNPRYSMRSFARALSIDPAVLSRALTDKRTLSYKVADRIVNSLSMSPQERRIFLESVAEDQKQRGLRRSMLEEANDEAAYSQIDNDIFTVIGEWYHYAIQQFTLVDGFQSNPAWIAERLGISVLEAKLAIQRLKSTGLIKEVDGKYVASHSHIDTENKSVTSPALRRHQKQMLQKAIYSLENDPFPTRSMTSMTMSIDPDKLPIARKLTQKFTEQLCEILGSGKCKTVYQLCISLFPLEKND